MSLLVLSKSRSRLFKILVLMLGSSSVLFLFQNCRVDQGLESSSLSSVESSPSQGGGSTEGSSPSQPPTDPGSGSTGQNGQNNNLNPKAAPSFPRVDVWPPAIDYAEFNTTACAGPLIGSHQTIDVGPGKTYTELTNVPWLTLGAGDVVNIYYRATPYKTKVGVISVATAQSPFIINGVTSANCEKPVLDGNGAVTATDAKTMGFGADIQDSGLLTIHRPPNTSTTYKAKYIVIQNLKFINVKQGSTFQDQSNVTQPYGKFSAAIYSPRVDYLYVKNCDFLDNAMAVFTNSKGGNNIDFSSYLIFRGNFVDRSGYSDDDHEHGVYTQGYRTLLEGNYFGQAQGGSSVKDRSSGTVFRYNKVMVSSRGLDLVESEENPEGWGVDSVRSDVLYNHAWVYGNIFINEFASSLGYSIRMIHWGFDNSSAFARNGTLHFYNNTVLTKGTDPTGYSWYTSIFQMGSGGYTADNSTNYQINAWENVFVNQAVSNGYGPVDFRLLWDIGKVNFYGANYLTTNWRKPAAESFTENSSTTLEGTTSVVDLVTAVPVSGSAIVNKGTTYTPNFSQYSSIAGFSSANLVHNSEFDFSNNVPKIKPKVLTGLRDLGALERP